MNPLVAPGVCRYTVNGTYAGRTVANVLDIHVDITGSVTDRATALEDQAEIIVSAWADEIMPALSDAYTATSVSWLDLDSLTGSTGSTTTGTGTDFPATGANTGQCMPGSVAMRVLKNITHLRGQRTGRLYIVGIGESYTTAAAPNTIVGGTVSDWNGHFADFKSAVEQSAGVIPPNYDSEIVVVHTHVDRTDPDDPVLVYDGRSAVSSFSVDPTLGSMRRRVRG